MNKYHVTVNYLRTETIMVEAKTKEEAINFVREGEFDPANIIDEGDEYPEIQSVNKVV